MHSAYLTGNPWLDVFVAIAIIGGGAKVLLVVVRFLRRVGHFLDDFYGEDKRPGQAQRPGLMQRMQTIEAEMHPNGGSSMRDAINRIEHWQELHLEHHERASG